MTIEIKMLAWSVFLGLAHVLGAAGIATHQRGLKWNAGNRDGEVKPLTGIAVRAAAANRNFLETFAFFAAAVLAVVVTHHETAHTALGAQIYFWARVAYVPVYAAGISYLRTLIWVVSMAGLVMVLLALF